jgi:tetratricopeptide (TPR) repeat protein
MTSFKHAIGAITIFSVLAPPLASAADLTKTRALYASASYEEALSELEKVDAAHWDEQVDEYRALCLVALGRLEEAEQALEHLIRLKPLHSVTNDRLSPRVVLLFQAVRKRTLPVLIRELYSKARNDYSTGNMDQAAAGFRELIVLLSEDDLIEQIPSLTDIQELSEGFLGLAEAKLAAASHAVAPAAAPVALPPPPEPTTIEPAQVFSPGDRDVVAPIEIERRMPPWNPPPSLTGPRVLRGVLEILCDTTGSIEFARVIESLSPSYDRELVAATKQWKFHPATKDGAPVKYRWLLEVVLNPR